MESLPAGSDERPLVETTESGPRPSSIAPSTTVSEHVETKRKPRLLMMGQRRSGKSSIASVVFHKLPPHETIYLEATARVEKQTLMSSFMEYDIWDFPGQINVFETPGYDIDAIFSEVGALIWVIDAQDDYIEAVTRLNSTILILQRSYPHIHIAVLVHKVDGLSDDFKLDIQRDITIRIQDELSDHGFENASVSFYATSIYNHSIFEAFSKIIQQLIPRLGVLEAMLTNLCRTCRFEKAYLFDVLSKIYIATDSETADMSSYELCSDYIDAIIDISDLYGCWPRSQTTLDRLEGPPWNQSLIDQTGSQWAESSMILHDSKKPVLLREVDRHLAVVAIMSENSYNHLPLINLNVDAIAQGLIEFFDITKTSKK